MKPGAPERNVEEERRERDRFLLLQHVFTLAEADPTTLLPAEQGWRDLGFSRTEGLSRIEGLVDGGFLVERGPRLQVNLTPRATEYLERVAGRRRSVRLLR